MATRPLAPSIPRLPDPSGLDMKDGEAVREYLTVLTSSLTKHLAQRPTPNQASSGLILKGEDGKNYRVRVDASGALISEPLGTVNPAPVPP